MLTNTTAVSPSPVSQLLSRLGGGGQSAGARPPGELHPPAHAVRGGRVAAEQSSAQDAQPGRGVRSHQLLGPALPAAAARQLRPQAEEEGGGPGPALPAEELLLAARRLLPAERPAAGGAGNGRERRQEAGGGAQPLPARTRTRRERRDAVSDHAPSAHRPAGVEADRNAQVCPCFLLVVALLLFSGNFESSERRPVLFLETESGGNKLCFPRNGSIFRGWNWLFLLQIFGHVQIWISFHPYCAEP